MKTSLNQWTISLCSLLSLGVVIDPAWGSIDATSIFSPYQYQIQKFLSTDLPFRLPTYLPPLAENKAYTVSVTPSLVNEGVTINLFNCQSQSQGCLVGSFSIESSDPDTPLETEIHQESLSVRKTIQTIPLNNGIQGYLINTNTSNYSTLTWEKKENEQTYIYKIRYASTNPEELQKIALSMDNNQPLQVLQKPNQDNPNTTIPLDTLVSSSPLLFLDDLNNQRSPNLDPNFVERFDPFCLTTTSNPESTSKPCVQITGNNTFTPEQLLENQQIRNSLQTLTAINEGLKQEALTDPQQYNELIHNNTVETGLNTLIGQQIIAIKNEINTLYLQSGYINTTVSNSDTFTLLKPTDNQYPADNLAINVTEGQISLGNIEITGTQRLDRNYILDRLALGLNTPINASELEEQLRLLKLNPLIADISARLKALPTPQTGQSGLEIVVQERKPFHLGIGFDNYSPASVGSERTVIDLAYLNLTGKGDSLTANYTQSRTGGVQTYDIGYQIPFNAMDGTLKLRGQWNSTAVTLAPFDKFNITGDKTTYEISYRQPIVRRLQEEIALSLGYVFEDGQTFTFDKPVPFGIGPDRNGVSRTGTLQFRQEYINRNEKGNLYVASQFNFGLGLFDVTQNEPPTPDGYYFSWLGQVQKTMKLGRDHQLVMQGAIQLTSDTLLPAQQFVIGGGNSVRGYRQNARSGDNGIRISLEDQITLFRTKNGQPRLQIIPFLDWGSVWNTAGNPNKLSDQLTLASIGLGINWKPSPAISIGIEYAYPFIQLEDKGNNLQDDGIFFNIQYQPY